MMANLSKTRERETGEALHLRRQCKDSTVMNNSCDEDAEEIFLGCLLFIPPFCCDAVYVSQLPC